MAQLRPWSVATIIEKNKIHSTEALIALLEVDIKNPVTGAYIETMRIANSEDDFWYQEKLYIAGGFDLDITKDAGEVVSVSLMVVDVTRALQGRMQEYGGGVGFVVRLIIVNTGALHLPPEGVEEFEIVAARSQNFQAIFTIGAENPLTLRFPRRRQFKDRCQWRYRGPECGYIGPLPTCDFSLQGPNGCAIHGNAFRFGGFPGIRTL